MGICQSLISGEAEDSVQTKTVEVKEKPQKEEEDAPKEKPKDEHKEEPKEEPKEEVKDAAGDDELEAFFSDEPNDDEEEADDSNEESEDSSDEFNLDIRKINPKKLENGDELGDDFGLGLMTNEDMAGSPLFQIDSAQDGECFMAVKFGNIFQTQN